MITYVDFSLFESPAKVLVNTVNTVGVMGKGIAKEFKRIYPEMFARYRELCERKMFNIGELWLYETPHKRVLNFPTKKHWRNPSKTEYIEHGLEKFVEIYQDARFTSVSFPMLGCGNGELDWKSQVKPLIEKHLKGLPVQIFIHLSPKGSSFVPEHTDPKATREWLRSEPQSLAFAEVWDDIVAAIGSQKHLSTLDNQESFTAEIFDDSDGGGIRIDEEPDAIMLHKEQMLDLWQQIRDVGLCIPDVMPGGLDRHADYVLPLLAELPYLKPIRQADRDTALNKSAIGLLVQPYGKPRALTGAPPEVHALSQQLQLV